MASSASPLAQEDAWPDVLEAEAATKGAGNENGSAVSVHLLHLRLCRSKSGHMHWGQASAHACWSSMLLTILTW